MISITTVLAAFALLAGTGSSNFLCTKPHEIVTYFNPACQRTCSNLQEEQASNCIQLVKCICESGYVLDDKKQECVPWGLCSEPYEFQINEDSFKIVNYHVTKVD